MIVGAGQSKPQNRQAQSEVTTRDVLAITWSEGVVGRTDATARAGQRVWRRRLANLDQATLLPHSGSASRRPGDRPGLGSDECVILLRSRLVGALRHVKYMRSSQPSSEQVKLRGCLYCTYEGAGREELVQRPHLWLICPPELWLGMT